jgi:hypothetical protein
VDLPTPATLSKVYREKFRSLSSRGEKRISDAYHMTIAEFMPAVQDAIAPKVKALARQIPIEEGDPFALAVQSVLSALVNHQIIAPVHQAWEGHVEAVRKRLLKDMKFTSGPKAWSPSGRRRPGPEFEKELERELQKSKLQLILRLDRLAGFRGEWHAAYFKPNDTEEDVYVSIPIEERMTLDKIRFELEYELDQAFDWRVIEKKLTEGGYGS